ncbi:MAG TPA: ribonuclease domain-containing protein [Verrucomicrobiae bacterium]|nr:ribonuclease domain-containing protein [Verrucomicrobiae bacterium]
MKSKWHYFFKFKLALLYTAIIISILLFIPKNALLQAFLHIKKLNPNPIVVIDNQKIKNTCLSLTNSFVKDIISRIKNGGPFYYKHDGILFHNFEKILRGQSSSNKYLEYTVGPRNMVNRGIDRIVTDNIHLHWFYTQDHYRSFLEIKNC